MDGIRRVVVVTDSTCYLPEEVIARNELTVVPLQVIIDGRVGVEGRDVTPSDVAGALRQRRSTVSTSRPSPGLFLETYRSVVAANPTAAVLSVHLSGQLSGTLDAARMAASELTGATIRVVDSRQVAMGLGMSVLAAARSAAAGEDLDAAAAAAQSAAERVTCLFYVDSLEWLRRGGRIGTAAALLGGALAMKPILCVQDGTIVPLEKVRTSAKAISRLQELAVLAAADDRVDVAIGHVQAADRAQSMAAQLRDRLPRLAMMYTAELGAVIAAHTGPGTLGVVVSPR